MRKVQKKVKTEIFHNELTGNCWRIMVSLKILRFVFQSAWREKSFSTLFVSALHVKHIFWLKKIENINSSS